MKQMNEKHVGISVKTHFATTGNLPKSDWIPACAGMTGRSGSALILTVVLTSLLAIVGIMFVMAANMDKIATSSVSAKKELQFAVDTVIAQISQKLIEDVPGVAGAEYYDYPGDEDHWLASLEPSRDVNNVYLWQQISDVNEQWNNAERQITPAQHQEPQLVQTGSLADADGDGVSDSRWTVLPGITSGKGKPVFAAIRIIDNGAMLNVNTGYKFDSASSDANDINGKSLLQINLMALAERPPTTTYTPADDASLLDERANYGNGTVPSNIQDYAQYVIWRYCAPPVDKKYTPFDLSDELELRNRYLLNNSDFDTRLEESQWGAELRQNTISTPVGDSASNTLAKWHNRAYDDGNINGGVDPNYAYRHLATTYNMDRIINPQGLKMANVNDSNETAIFTAIKESGISDATAAQITANLIDYCDNDSNVTAYNPPTGGGPYYGFETPCIYISELAYKLASWLDTSVDPPVTITGRSYAIELFKPYNGDVYPDSAYQKWQLRIGGQDISIDNWTAGLYHVVLFEDPLLENTGSPLNGCPKQKLGDEVASGASLQTLTPIGDIRNTLVELQREVIDSTGASKYITVDSVRFPNPDDPSPGNCTNGSIERNIDLHKCIRHLWNSSPTAAMTLGIATGNSYHGDPDNRPIQAHPANNDFTNVGEIGMIFSKCAYSEDSLNCITPADTEATARVNLADSSYQNIFNYLTVFDPTQDNINNDSDDWTNESEPNRTPEFKIPGRININTAPWYVLAQLPWMTSHLPSDRKYALAKAIIAYRDKLTTPVDYQNRGAVTGIGNIREEPGFESIGELNFLTAYDNAYRIGYYAADGADLTGYPDLTPSDGDPNGFEERDVIFTRISNLVTVRSDVFTAYILVRLGPDGPQKRVIAILDRSDVYSANDRIKVVALWPVPDSR